MMSDTSQLPLSWVAVRKGDTYCAPACGHGCTFERYQAALDRATKAAKSLGPKWKPEVHENMGWHSQVRCGEVYMTVPGGWGSGGTYMVGTDSRGILGESGKTAKAAKRRFVNFLIEERDRAQALLNEIL